MYFGNLVVSRMQPQNHCTYPRTWEIGPDVVRGSPLRPFSFLRSPFIATSTAQRESHLDWNQIPVERSAMNAIDLLEDDHDRLQSLVKELQEACRDNSK